MALVYTNENCVGCNKCISGCRCMGANRQAEKNGVDRIEVGSAECVACGACFDVCKHKARAYYDIRSVFLQTWQEGNEYRFCLHRHSKQIIRMSMRRFWAV